MLSEKDNRVLISNKKINYSSNTYKYLGGEFSSNANDYVEALIYDTNDNFLEAGIVDKSDYMYDEESKGIRLNTGTILRKMGYDKGKFVVKYNFLRRIAGSHETILVDELGIPHEDEFDVNQIGNELFLKEYKYFIQEMDSSRKELRLFPNTVNEEKYLRDFYNLGAKNKKLQSLAHSESPNAPALEFVGINNQQKAFSNKVRLTNGTFDNTMVGGKLTIPGFFIKDRIERPLPATAEDDGAYNEMETISQNGVCEARFRILSVPTGYPQNNNLGRIADGYFKPTIELFRKPDGTFYEPDEELPEELIAEIKDDRFNSSNKARSWPSRYKAGAERFDIMNIMDMHDDPYDSYVIKRAGDRSSIIDLVSNSILDADVTTQYEWEIWGYDYRSSKRGKFLPRRQDGGGYYKIYSQGHLGTRPEGGEVPISDDEIPLYANEDSTGIKAFGEISGPSDDVPRLERDGNRLRVELWGNNARFTIRLKITKSTGVSTAQITIPSAIEAID